MKVHEIKLLPQYWDYVELRIKNAEVRYNDRGYVSGDRLVLCEWDGQRYSGRRLERTITAVFPLEGIGLEGWVLLCMR